MQDEQQQAPQGETPIGVPNFGLAPDPNAPKPSPVAPVVNHEEAIQRIKAESSKTQAGLHKALEEQKRQLALTQQQLDKYEQERFKTLPEVEQVRTEASRWQQKAQEYEAKFRQIEQERLQQQAETFVMQKYGLTRAELEAVSPTFGETFDPNMLPLYAAEAVYNKYKNTPPPVQQAVQVPQATDPARNGNVGRVTTPTNSNSDLQAQYNAAMKGRNFDQVHTITEQAFQKGVVIDTNSWMSG